MSDPTEPKPWVCLECLTYFYPNHPEYKCPKCKGKSRPSRMYDSEKNKIYYTRAFSPKIIKCPNCTTKMLPGIMTEAAEGIFGFYHYDSIKWTANNPRYILPPINSISPTVYACPNCGKLELYIQIQDETKQSQITRWTEQTEFIGYCNKCNKEYDFNKNGYFCPFCKGKNTEKKRNPLTHR